MDARDDRSLDAAGTESVPRAPDFGLAGRRVLVAGLGESGLAMARWCARAGATVSVVDTREAPPGLEALRRCVPDARFACSPLDADAAGALLEGVDLLAWSPGLSASTGGTAAFLAAARARGTDVAGEVDLFGRALVALRAAGVHAPKVIAITGTNGKTTTTKLCGALCEAAGRRVAVAGNVSPAMLDVLADALDAGGDALPDVWVLELSSFQLALSGAFAANAATVLNVTQDHLDWHGTMDDYVAAKRRVYPAGGVSAWNRDDPLTRPSAEEARTISFGLDAPARAGDLGLLDEGGLRWLAEAVVDEMAPPTGRRRRNEAPPVRVRRLMPADALRIRGSHNQANALAALALARAIDLPMAPMLHALRDYAGEPHRCEPVALIDDVEWIDDSKGTNVGATVAALQGLGDARRPRIVLIAGGDGKGQDFAPLAEAVARHAKAVLLIGRDAPAIRRAIAGTGVPLTDCATLEEAVRRAAPLASTGDAVLLSPACASFDMFRGYAHRAEVFSAAVHALAREAGQPC